MAKRFVREFNEDGKYWGQEERIYDKRGYARTIYLWAKCPNCNECRWVREKFVKDNVSIPWCHSCRHESLKKKHEITKEDVADMLKRNFHLFTPAEVKNLGEWYVANVLHAQK